MAGSRDQGEGALRIDRWLWFTRFFKTRSLAAKAVAGGHVRVNGERARPGQRVAAGDRLDIVRDRLTWEIEVLGVPARRGPASEAQRHFRESEASAARRRELSDSLRNDRLQMPRTDGRPDKHTRRLLRRRNRGR